MVALFGFLAQVQSTVPVYNIDNYLVATEYAMSLWLTSSSQKLFIGTNSNKIYRSDAASSQVIIAGGGDNNSPSSVSGSGAATSAHFYSVNGISGDSTERYIYVANTGHNTIRAIDTTTGQIATIAGSGGPSVGGDNGPATSAGVLYPSSVTVDSHNNVYTTSFHNGGAMNIRKIDATTGIISTYLTTTVSEGDSGDGGTRTSAEVRAAKSIFIQNNRMYIGTQSCLVRMLDMTTNIITTIAGTDCESNPNGPTGAGNYGYYNYWFESGDGISALSATITPCASVSGEKITQCFL